MKKRILITSTDLMMVQFLIPHVTNLAENGFEVEIACSDVGGRMDEIREKLNDYVNKIHVVRLVRSPVSPGNFKGYKDMKRVINAGNYDIIWTNEPVMGVATRLAARKARKAQKDGNTGTRVIYMVHGFHFYTGAPKLNWMLYYPVEKFAGHFCDSVVTVNREDFERAKRMKLPDVKYIHGIGINTERLSIKKDPNALQSDRELSDSSKCPPVKNRLREELGLTPDDFIVLSVGELNKNKNQKVIIDAISKINDDSIHYVLCGKGANLENLVEQTKSLGIEERVHFLGYRTDVVDICSQSDVYVMPSLREGLPVASLEAMYCGLPLVTSDIRGLVDVMEDGVTGYTCKPNDTDSFAKYIEKLKQDTELRKQMGKNSEERVVPYCIENTKKEVEALFAK